MVARPAEVVETVARILEQLGIPYCVGGSVASAVYGFPRTTLDVDFVIDPRADQLDTLAGALEKEFYVSRDAMREAFRDRRAFNAIHLETASKADLFLLGHDSFDREELDRRTPQQLTGPGGRPVMFKSPEDTVLRKLRWFRDGGEVSENQWRDVLGVLLVQKGRLDEPYLDRWAAHLGVADLLVTAREEAAKG